MKNPIETDIKALISIAKTPRRSNVCAYGFVFAFLACTAFIAFNPSNNLFASSSSSSLSNSFDPYRSQVSSLLSHFFPNSTGTPLPARFPAEGRDGPSKDAILGSGSAPIRGDEVSHNGNRTGSGLPGTPLPEGVTGKGGDGSSKDGILGTGSAGNGTGVPGTVGVGSLPGGNFTGSGLPGTPLPTAVTQKGRDGSSKHTILGTGSAGNGTRVPGTVGVGSLLGGNFTGSGLPGTPLPTGVTENGRDGSSKDAILEGNLNGSGVPGTSVENVALAKNPNGSGVPTAASSNGNDEKSGDSNGSVSEKKEKWIEDMVGCDIFRGQWVKDDSYPLYPEGSCPHIDEPFDCFLNGRPDRDYQKLRWKPDGCNIPRLNATDMLERMRGKRLVFVGDSLNRNMWESLVCILRNSVKDKKKVFEASGRREYRTLGSYSFLFTDYNASVEFFRSPFLVQEWEMHEGNATKETLRLDIIEKSSSKYKDADFIIFNTGHWWTHEKTSKGKDYYQEGNRVYSELNVDEAFHKALNTWAKWVDTNVNPKKSLVFFRGYSASHFSGGQWNSGGACDRETEPIKNEKYLSSYPPKMSVLESVLGGMTTPVSYLNITRMTDYRKDAHPSVYRKQSLTEEERRDPERFQDCSHWCLPGVPDSWNEILYALLLIKQYRM